MAGPHSKASSGTELAASLEAASQLALVHDALGVVTWVWDIPGDRTDWYGDLSPLLGLPPRSYTGGLPEFQQHLHPDDVAASRSRFVACLKGIAPTYRAEERVRWPDGSEHWLETHGRGTYQADGRACRVAGVVKDITDRKRAEQVLQASEERFRRLIEEAPVAIGMSRDEFVLYANPAFVALFGYGQAADVVGRRVLDLVAPQQHAEFAQRSRARAEGLPADSLYELTLKRRDGSELQSLLAVTRVAFPEGPAMLVFVQDISERAQARQALHELNASLEQRVSQRTAELEASNAALAAARDAAEAGTRAKDEFLAHMSHEIRTPMNAIIGMTHLALRSEGLPERPRAYLERIQGASQLLLGVINAVLDYSKIEAGQLGLTLAEFRIADVCERVLSLLGQEAADKGLVLQAHRAPDVPEVLLGDPLRLEQVLINLCGNAVKFTERGSVHLDVERQPSPLTASARLCLRVRDTGIGITQEQQSRLFRPFDQLDPTITRRYGGTGLGLALSRRLVELMGGQIQVRSQPGQGSEFEIALDFALPAITAERPVAPGPRMATEPAAQDIERLRGRRLLLVEDNELNKIVACDLLSEVGGAQVVIAENGRLALDRLRGMTFDAVLMDLQMPEMDGFEATLALRRDPSLAHLPVIAMTAHALVRERQRCLAAGMNDFITKPFEPSELFAVLARWLPDPTQPNLAAPAEPGAPVNFDAGLRRCLGRQDLYVRILRRFTESSGPELAALQGWLQGNDAGPLRDMAHSLISTAGTIGADALSQAARALQAALAEGNCVAWAEPVRRLAAEHAAALTAVHGWLRDFEAADAPNKPDLPAGSSASI